MSLRERLLRRQPVLAVSVQVQAEDELIHLYSIQRNAQLCASLSDLLCRDSAIPVLVHLQPS